MTKSIDELALKVAVHTANELCPEFPSSEAEMDDDDKLFFQTFAREFLKQYEADQGEAVAEFGSVRVTPENTTEFYGWLKCDSDKIKRGDALFLRPDPKVKELEAELRKQRPYNGKAMSVQEHEEKVAELEAEVARLKSQIEIHQRGLQASEKTLINEIAELEAEVARLNLAVEQNEAITQANHLRKVHPLDFPLEVFLADLATRPANIIRAELACFAPYAGTGTFDIEPPFTVRHLCMFSRSEMRKWPNFGRKCLNEVEEMLRARGLQLFENHDERSLRLLREHKEYFK